MDNHEQLAARRAGVLRQARPAFRLALLRVHVDAPVVSRNSQTVLAAHATYINSNVL